MAGKITKNNSAVYLIVGNDEYCKENKVNSLVNSLLSKENKELNFDTIDCEEVEDFDFELKVKIIPFLAEKRVVVIKNIEKLEDDLKEKLLNYINNPSTSTCLILSSTLNITTKKIFEKHKFLQSISEKVETFPFYQLYDNQLRIEIKEKFNKLGKQVSEEVVEMLVDRVNNNLRELDSEIEKIMLYTTNKKFVGLEDVQYLISGLNEKNIYDLQNTLGDKDLVKSLKILSNIFYFSDYDDGKTGLYLLTSIYGYFKKIWTSKFLIKEGYTEDEISKKIGMHYFFIKRFLKQVNNFNEKTLKLIFSELTNSDISIKTSKIKYTQIIIERLIYIICV
ncbi:MAG: DNA polymerase III subunit delta [Candidatus Firestonebacteria bacterium]